MYIVTKRYGRNETRVSDFRTEQEAIATIFEKLKEDRHFKLTATYCLYEGADMLKEYTQNEIPSSMDENNDSAESAGSQKGTGQSFAPTPFNTTPHLGPRTGLKDVNDDKDKDN